MRSRAVRLIVLFGLLILAVVLPSVLSGGAKDHAAALRAQLYSPGSEVEGSLTAREQFWQTRLTYPTGHFDQRWVVAAAREAKLIKSGIPAGMKRYRGSSHARSINALSAARPLGPQPQESTGCQPPCFTFGFVSGRVSAIAFDPTTLTEGARKVYIAPDGGGIWKSTNCCTPTTTWSATTENIAGSDVSTTAVDDVTIDPANPNTIYAATGDISFGSFSFGSAGVLKSTDAGAHWQTLGASDFAPPYLVPGYGTYPQYQAVTKVKVDPNDSNNIIVGTKTGLYFSYNAGTSWAGPCLTNSFSSQRQDITDLIVRDGPGSTTTLFAAVGTRGFGTFVQQNLGLNGANGVYKLSGVPASGCPSVASWTPLTSGWPAGTASGVPCNPPIPDDGSVCAATANKLGRIEMAIAPSTLATATPNDDVLYAEVQAVDPQTPCGVLQALGPGTSRGCFLGLWRTANGGTTWTQVSDAVDMSFFDADGLPQTITAGPCGEDTPQMWYDMGLAVDPNNPDAFFLDAIDIWKSTDGGQTLTDISCGYYTGLNPISAPVHVDNHVLAYAPGSSTTLLAGNDGGIYVSNNAANAPQGTLTGVNNPPTFTDTNKTMNTIEFYGGDISANFGTAANAFIVGGAQDNGSSFYQFTAPGSTCPPAGCQWSQRIGGDGFFARIESKQGQRVFMESQNGNLQRSTTGPAGPYQAAAGGWSGDRLSFIFPYEIDKFACPLATCDHMIAGSYRVWETINGADSWYANSGDLTKGTLGDRSYINQLAYAPTNNGNAIVGTNDGNVQYGFGLGSGSANSANWVNVTGGNSVLPNRPIQDVAISPANSLIGYAAAGGFDQNTPSTPGHVFRVVCEVFCASFTWSNKSGNLPNIPVNSIIINPNNRKQGFAGTDWGLYYTDDITATSPQWFHFTDGLPNTMIWELSVDRGATTLAIFTRARGAFAMPLPTVSATRTSLFTDTFEGPGPPPPADNAGWSTSQSGAQTQCPWHDGTPDNHTTPTGSHSWTTAQYPANCNSNLTTPAITVPSGYDSLQLSFWTHHDTEAGAACGGVCDYGVVQLQVDDNNPMTNDPFETISGRYEDLQPNYYQTTLSLPDSAAGHTIHLRFHFQSDTNVQEPHTGWWIDDINVSGEPPSEGPTGVKVSSFTAHGTRGAVVINWRTATEINTLGFNVWRFSHGKGVKLNRTLIAAKGRTRGAAYTVVDRHARPGVTHTYRLELVSKDGRRAWAARTAVRVKR
jgi:hypothetical protein